MESSLPAPPTRGDRRRGRPRVLDRENVAEVVFRLWSQRGYGSTSWSDIAEATGISTRTLLRHFSTKSDIAWVGVPSATVRLREALAATGESTPLSESVRIAVRESVSRSPRVQRVSPEWLRLISGEPELAAMAHTAYRPWIDELAAYILRRRPVVPPAIARALATAYQAAAFAALTDWASSGAHGDPADAVDSMLRWLDIHTPHPSPETH